MSEYRLLEQFKSLFSGQPYLHRKSNQGDSVACCLYEDLVELGKSSKIVERVKSRDRVVNAKNTTVGKTARRGDGTFGELVPQVSPALMVGFVVARGPVANIEIGVEAKILAKAMIKQIDRVISDLKAQVAHFKSCSSDVLSVGIVGINYAPVYLSFEGSRKYKTDGGSTYKHPIQEAPKAEERLRRLAAPAFDEFLILPFCATNEPPYAFSWIDAGATRLQYGALLTRISRSYDQRF